MPHSKDKLREEIAERSVKAYNDFIRECGEIGELDLEEIFEDAMKEYGDLLLKERGEAVTPKVSEDHTPRNEWEEDFAEKFGYELGGDAYFVAPEVEKAVIAFIRSLLSKERTRVVEDLTNKLNRVEVIDHTKSFEEGGGRRFVYWDTKNETKVELSFQDEGRTLKIFLTNQPR